MWLWIIILREPDLFITAVINIYFFKRKKKKKRGLNPLVGHMVWHIQSDFTRTVNQSSLSSDVRGAGRGSDCLMTKALTHNSLWEGQNFHCEQDFFFFFKKVGGAVLVHQFWEPSPYSSLCCGDCGGQKSPAEVDWMRLVPSVVEY